MFAAFVPLGVHSAAAHDMWLLPSDFAAEEGELIPIALRVGHAGEAEVVRRQEARIVRFEAIDPDGKVSAVQGFDGSDTAGFIRPATAGSWALIYESTEAYSELAAEAFAGYLAEEGLDDAIAWRLEHGEADQPGRELYRRSLKSLIRVGTGSAPDRAVGLPLELVLERPPSGEKLEVALQVLWQGEPLDRALVDLQPVDGEGEPLSGRTDKAGRLHLPITPGHWMAAVVHIERSSAEQSARAEWQSVFSTLTFAIAEP